MTAEEKVTKRRLGPDLWAHLDAVSRGSFVNHLRGRRREDRELGWYWSKDENPGIGLEDS